MPKVVDHAVRRAEITEVTAREIARVGLEGLAVRHIARAAGSTSGLLSYYFADKHELLMATFRDRTSRVSARIAAAMADGSSPLDAYLGALLPVDEDTTLTWRVWLAFWGAAVGDETLAAEQRRRYDAYTAHLADALRQEQMAGRLRADLDLAHEARRLVTVIDGVSVQALFAPDVWTPTMQRRLVDEHVASLRPRPRPKRKGPKR